MKEKLLVYTAMFGDYDVLHEPYHKYENCTFLCITNNRLLKSNVWEFLYIDEFTVDYALMNRKYKILPHRYFDKYSYSLYVDSNIIIKEDPYDLLIKYRDVSSFNLPRHFERDCIYKEAVECISLGKSRMKLTLLQMKKYYSEGFPQHYGLAENNIIFRKHNDKRVISLMECWWSEFITSEKRDQLCLAYVLWKNNIHFDFMEENSRRKNNYFGYSLHKNDKDIFLLSKIAKYIKIAIIKYFTNIAMKRMLRI